jgi:hypothetical protein
MRASSCSFLYLQPVLFFHLLSGSPAAEDLLAAGTLAGTPASFVLNRGFTRQPNEVIMHYTNEPLVVE